MPVEPKRKDSWQMFLWILGRIPSEPKYTKSKHLNQLSEIVDRVVLLTGRILDDRAWEHD